MAKAGKIIGKHSLSHYLNYLHRESVKGASIEYLIKKYEIKMDWQKVLTLTLEILKKLDYLELTRDIQNPELYKMVDDLRDLIEKKL